jgi:transposase-like protein
MSTLQKDGFDKKLAFERQYHCKSCGRRGVVNPEAKYSETGNRCCVERSSMRGICRLFKVSSPTLAKWLKKAC